MTNRLRFRIATGPSLSALLQEVSHGMEHTRPQTELNGLVSVIASRASSSFPSQIREM